MNIRYREFTPSVALQPYVDSYWVQSFEADSPRQESPVQRCLPLGTMEIIVHLDENHCHALIGGSWQLLPRAYVVGLYKDTVIWKSTGTTSLFGIRLKPESLLQLFQVPPAGVFNNFVELETFFGKKINRFADTIYAKADAQSLVQTAEAFFLTQLRHSKEERNYIFEATRLMRQFKGTLSIERISDHLFISKRQLQRSFKDSFGTSPKTYSRILRFRNAYEYLQQAPSAPRWQDVTYESGYSDQAHFIRDFKEFTGDVPSTYVLNGEQYYQLADTLL